MPGINAASLQSLARLNNCADCDEADVSRGGGGWLLPPKSYVDVPARRRKSDFLHTNFLPNFPPISIPFLQEKHTILTKLGAFYNDLPKIHPIYVIWAPSSLMKPPPHRYTKFHEKSPQKAGTCSYTMSMWEPPGDVSFVQTQKTQSL